MDTITEAINNLEKVPKRLKPHEIRIELCDGLINIEKGLNIPQDIMITLCDFDMGSMTPEEITANCRKVSSDGRFQYCIYREM